MGFTLVSAASSGLNQSLVNNTNNGTNSTLKGSGMPNRDALYYVTVICSILIMLVGTFGNFLVLIIFSLRWSALKTCEVFMVSLAVADLIGTFTVPLEMLRDALQLHDPGNGHLIGCQLSSWLGSTCISVSAFTLVTIAIDRFFVVVWPLRIRQGLTFFNLVVVFVTWLIGACIASPYFIHLEQKAVGVERYRCMVTLDINERKKFYMALFVIQVLIPTLAMSGLYSFIIFKLRSGSVSARRLSETDNVVTIRTRRQRKATKLFIIVVIIFVSLVLPFNIFSLLATYNKVPLTKTNFRIYRVLSLLLAANSCVNPLIYSRLHKSFRRSTIALLFGCFCPKYYRYEWEAKFVSRSSYYRRRRFTDQSNTRNTITSFRKSGFPFAEDAASQRVSTGTPPRSLSVLSSRSSRISSSGSDDVFARKNSTKSANRSDDSPKIHLQKIPEQNGSYTALEDTRSNAPSPDPEPGKYTQIKDRPLEELNATNGAFLSELADDQKKTTDNYSEGKTVSKLSAVTKQGYESISPSEQLNNNFLDTEL
eukprot:gene4543-20795_t